jgi:hypothetical protein
VGPVLQYWVLEEPISKRYMMDAARLVSGIK